MDLLGFVFGSSNGADKNRRHWECLLKFENIIKGKTVCVVGRSPHLHGLGLGNTIDSHDFVIRVNAGTPEEKEAADFGTKTSAVAIALTFRNIEFYQHLLETEKKRNKEGFFVFCPTQMADIHPRWYRRKTGNIFDVFAMTGSEAPLIHWGDQKAADLEALVGTQPTTGLATAFAATSAKPAEVFLCGFSFYSSGATYAFENQSFKSVIRDFFKPKTGHDSAKEVSFWKSVGRTEHVKVDDVFSHLVFEGHYRDIPPARKLVHFIYGIVMSLPRRIVYRVRHNNSTFCRSIMKGKE